MIVIIGAEGQLGRDLQSELAPLGAKPLRHPELDVTDRGAVEGVLSRLGLKDEPSWIVNAAAKTHVDRCESEDTDAFRVNALGARYVAEACARLGVRLVHVSTDYVFDGSKHTPYTEKDTPRPINAYGVTKLAGEHYVRYALADHYIVRTSGVYGTSPCRGKGGQNFVDKMLQLASEGGELRVVDDEVLTPTFAEDLARQIRGIIEKPPPAGVYHATNDGQCSWFEFASEIFRRAGVRASLRPVAASEWQAPARRPSYSVLANEALRRAGLDMMGPWQDALARYLAKK